MAMPKTIQVKFNLEDLDDLFEILSENIKVIGGILSSTSPDPDLAVELDTNVRLIGKIGDARTRLRQQTNRRKRHEPN